MDYKGGSLIKNVAISANYMDESIGVSYEQKTIIKKRHQKGAANGKFRGIGWWTREHDP